MGDPERLLEPFEALGSRREREAEPTRLALVPAGAEAQVCATAAEHVEGRRGLDQRTRRSIHDARDERTQKDAARRLGEEAERRICLEHRLARAAPAAPPPPP